MPFSLFEDLKQSGFHSSILTTYSVDPAFYDANIQYRLRAYGCQNNLLMADAPMLDQALDEMPDAFVHAGRKYLIVPVGGQGCFHPKIILRYGKAKARLVLGSANATSAGWASNLELLSALEWSEGSDGTDAAAHLRLISKTHDWLISRMPAEWDVDLAYKIDLLRSQSPWLANAVRSEGPEELSDGTAIDLLLSDPNAPQGLSDQLIATVAGEVERLVIISPYWDDGLAALHRLHTAFGGPSVHIFVTLPDAPEARQSTFPTEALAADVKASFHRMGDAAHNRFLHAKFIMARTRDHDYFLYGSANCTTAALGKPGAPGINCEATIRRVPRGTIDRHLELNYSELIDPLQISAPEEREKPSSLPPPFHPGRIERKGQKLVWSCPDGISAAGATFIIDSSRIQVEAPVGLRPYVQVARDITDRTIIVHVELADGRISRPVIVADPDMLQAAAPNPLAGNLKRKLDAVLNGESDLIDLARDVHLIFEDGGSRRSALLSSGGGGGRSITCLVGQDYESPEAFRKAVAQRADLHSGSLPHPDNPALQLILQIVLRGIVQLQDSRSLDHDDVERTEAILAGEAQDDWVSDDPSAQAEPKQVDEPISPPATVTLQAFERNRSSLLRAIERFEAYVAALTTARKPLDLDFVTRTLFMIYLMLYGCSRPYAVEGGGTRLLIPFSGIGTREEDAGFLKRAARLLSLIWGRKFQDGMMARIPVDPEASSAPTPILTLVILSRWIMGAILHEVRHARGAKALAEILERQVPQIFWATSAFADLDSAEVEEVIGQMATHMGLTQLQADAIQATVQELSRSAVVPGS